MDAVDDGADGCRLVLEPDPDVGRDIRIEGPCDVVDGRVVSSNVVVDEDDDTAVNFSLPPAVLLGRRDEDPDEWGCERSILI